MASSAGLLDPYHKIIDILWVIGCGCQSVEYIQNRYFDRNSYL